MPVNPWVTLAIVALTFLGIAIGRYPIIKSNRTTIALMGVALLLATSQVRFGDLPGYVDFDTIILLFSMMILNANLKLGGFFGVAARGIIRMARSPRAFLAVEILGAGILSALFLNDTICLMFTPFLIGITDSLKRNPLPYLIALATASNVGSAATLTGNPQNMIIGVASGISYLDFLLSLAPVALLGMAVIWLVLVLLYPREFNRGGKLSEYMDETQAVNKPLLVKTLLVTAALLAAFLLGAPVALAAFLSASFLLITRRHQPAAVFTEFDWTLLVFFAAMFIVSGSLETSGVTTNLINLGSLASKANVLNLTFVTAGLSNLISNVPAVMLLRSVAANMPNARLGWITIAAASTLAGNLTLLGSVANLIVAESAERWRIKLSFWEYTRSGLIITLVTLLIAVGWLTLIQFWH